MDERRKKKKINPPETAAGTPITKTQESKQEAVLYIMGVLEKRERPPFVLGVCVPYRPGL